MHKPSVPHCRMVEGEAEAQRGQENGPGAQLAGWKSSGVRTAPLGLSTGHPQPAAARPRCLGEGAAGPPCPASPCPCLLPMASVPLVGGCPMLLSLAGGRCGARQGGEASGWGSRQVAGLMVKWPGGWSGVSATGETPGSLPPQTGDYVESHRLVGDPVCLPSGPHCRAEGVSALVETVTRLHLCTWCPAQHMSSMAKDSSPTSWTRSGLHGWPGSRVRSDPQRHSPARCDGPLVTNSCGPADPCAWYQER